MTMKTIVIYDSTEKNIVRRILIIPEGMTYSQAEIKVYEILEASGVDSVDDLDGLNFHGFGGFKEAGFVGIDLRNMRK